MSIEALSLVFKIDSLSSPVKFVLVSLANCADAAGTCYPSVDHIAEVTSQDRKTVLSSMATLVQGGWISDTGERRGRTKQIKVWKIHLDKAVPQKELFHAEQSRTENGTLSVAAGDSQSSPITGRFEGHESAPKTEGSRNRNSSEFDAKGSRKRDTEPSRTIVCVGAYTHEGRSVTAPAYAAIQLRLRGMRITASDPNLLAAINEGVLPETLVDLAVVYPDKSAGYVIATARRQRAAGASATPVAAPRADGRPGAQRSVAGNSPAVVETNATRLAAEKQFCDQQVDLGFITRAAADERIAAAITKWGTPA